MIGESNGGGRFIFPLYFKNFIMFGIVLVLFIVIIESYYKPRIDIETNEYGSKIFLHYGNWNIERKTKRIL